MQQRTLFVTQDEEVDAAIVIVIAGNRSFVIPGGHAYAQGTRVISYINEPASFVVIEPFFIPSQIEQIKLAVSVIIEKQQVCAAEDDTLRGHATFTQPGPMFLFAGCRN